MSTDDQRQEENVYEKVGPWTEVKHEIIGKYAKVYSTIMTARQNPRFHHVYIDAFAGAGQFISKRTGLLVPGSPQIALDTTPPFRDYHFVDIDAVKIAALEQIAAHRADVTVHQGNCNAVLIQQILPRVRYEEYHRGLCILDPYGLHLDWTTVAAVGATGSVEVFLNFPTMDINRNVLRKDPAAILPEDASRMTAFWGDESWRQRFYQPRPQMDLWGKQDDAKSVDNEAVADAYRQRLRSVAGFAYVPRPLPMRNSSNAILYYLFFASHKAVAGDIGGIVEQTFAKYRAGG